MRTGWFLVLVVLSAVIGLAGCSSAAPLPPGQAIVVEVVDGDTLVVRVDRSTGPLRLLGIDTPETKRPGVAVECWGREASAALAELAPPGTPLRLERDTEARDHFGRLLAHAWLADGRSVEEELLRGGHAATLVIAPNIGRQGVLAATEAEARAAGRGLWGACGGPHVPLRQPTGVDSVPAHDGARGTPGVRPRGPPADRQLR